MKSNESAELAISAEVLLLEAERQIDRLKVERDAYKKAFSVLDAVVIAFHCFPFPLHSDNYQVGKIIKFLQNEHSKIKKELSL